MSKDFFELELEAFVDDTYAPQLSAEPLQLEYDATDRMSLEYSGFSLFGVNASEDGNLITVSGIQMRDMQRCIREYFGTSRIHSHMFTKMTWRSFSFFKFFAPEIYRICDLLIEWKTSPSKSGYLMPRKTLQEIKEALLRNTWLGQTQRELTTSRLDKSKLKELVLEPLDYQWEFFDVYDRLTQLYSMKGALLNAAPGAGKTYMGLSLFHILDEDVDHVIVVSPLQAVDEVWAENIRLRFKKEQTFWTSTGDKPLHKNYKYYIVHYQALENFVEWAKKNLKNKNNKSILDECHNFNDLTTLRTSTYVELCKELGISDSLWMSGTAIKALSIEAIPLLKCIDPFFTDAVMARFKKIYSGATNAATALLRYRLDMISFKVEKKQLGLPDPIFDTIKIKTKNASKYTAPEVMEAMRVYIRARTEYYLDRREQDQKTFQNCLHIFSTAMGPIWAKDKNAQAQYSQYLDDLDVVIAGEGDFSTIEQMKSCRIYEDRVIIPSLPPEHRSAFREVRAAVKYVKLKIQGECLGNVVGRLRIACHLEMVGAVDFVGICNSSTKKTLFFTSYVEVIEEALGQCQRLGLNPVGIYGKTSHQLEELLTRLRKFKNVNPAIASIQTLATAVPMTMCDIVVFLNAPWRDYILQQAVSRVHRRDVDSGLPITQVYVYFCALDTGEIPNLSQRTFDVLAWSQEEIDAILGIKSPYQLKDADSIDSSEGVSLESRPGLTSSYVPSDLYEDAKMLFNSRFSLESDDTTTANTANMEGISHELLTAATEDMEQRAGMLDEAQELIGMSDTAANTVVDIATVGEISSVNEDTTLSPVERAAIVTEAARIIRRLGGDPARFKLDANNPRAFSKEDSSSNNNTMWARFVRFLKQLGDKIMAAIRRVIIWFKNLFDKKKNYVRFAKEVDANKGMIQRALDMVKAKYDAIDDGDISKQNSKNIKKYRALLRIFSNKQILMPAMEANYGSIVLTSGSKPVHLTLDPLEKKEGLTWGQSFKIANQRLSQFQTILMALANAYKDKAIDRLEKESDTPINLDELQEYRNYIGYFSKCGGGMPLNGDSYITEGMGVPEKYSSWTREAVARAKVKSETAGHFLAVCPLMSTQELVSFAQEYESPLVVEKQLKDAADAIETSILKLQKKISEASSSGAKTNHSEISRMVERISKISRQFGNMLKTVPEVYEDYGMAIKTTCDIYKTLFDFYGIKTYTDHWMTFIWNWYDV